jgi:site-specific recombinase XerD
LSREAQDCRPSTLRDYQGRLSQYAKFLEEKHHGVALGEVNRQHVEGYIIWLRDNGRKPWTVRTNYRALKAFYNWMVEDDLIPVSPMVKIRPPKTPKIGKEFLAPKQFAQLLRQCNLKTFIGARNASILMILWATGMRRSELVGLMLDDLDWRGGKIRVMGKGRKERYTPFTDDAKQIVWRYMSYRKDSYPNLWLTEEREPLQDGGLATAVNRIYQYAGISVKDTCHVFRRSWAMRNLKAGIPIKHIQLVGGWESVTTLEGYVRAMTSDDALSSNWV